jgi:hypothetical protein
MLRNPPVMGNDVVDGTVQLPHSRKSSPEMEKRGDYIMDGLIKRTENGALNDEDTTWAAIQPRFLDNQYAWMEIRRMLPWRRTVSERLRKNSCFIADTPQAGDIMAILCRGRLPFILRSVREMDYVYMVQLMV